ncbi:MAG: hypothetical protein GXO43_05940 [Crenarchaeota archaeon]|nr:hypothetical protein [Thermoproteota archaeon]
MVKLRPVLVYGFQGYGSRHSFVTIMFVIEDPVLDELKARCLDEIRLGETGDACREYREYRERLERSIYSAVQKGETIEL